MGHMGQAPVEDYLQLGVVHLKGCPAQVEPW